MGQGVGLWPAELVPGTLSVISARMDYLPEYQVDLAQALEDPAQAFIANNGDGGFKPDACIHGTRLHGRNDDGVVFNQTLCIIFLFRFDTLGKKVVADGFDDILGMVFFVHYPAYQLILGLWIIFIRQLYNHSNRFLYCFSVFEHRLYPRVIIINATWYLAVCISGE